MHNRDLWCQEFLAWSKFLGILSQPLEPNAKAFPLCWFFSNNLCPSRGLTGGSWRVWDWAIAETKEAIRLFLSVNLSTVHRRRNNPCHGMAALVRCRGSIYYHVDCRADIGSKYNTPKIYPSTHRLKTSRDQRAVCGLLSAYQEKIPERQRVGVAALVRWRGKFTAMWTKGLLLVANSMTYQGGTLLHTDWKHQAVESSVLWVHV
jgi:hypothetical protein